MENSKTQAQFAKDLANASFKFNNDSANQQNFIFQTNYKELAGGARSPKDPMKQRQGTTTIGMSKGSTSSEFNKKQHVQSFLNVCSDDNSERDEKDLYLTSKPGFGRRFNSLQPFDATVAANLHSPKLEDEQRWD